MRKNLLLIAAAIVVGGGIGGGVAYALAQKNNQTADRNEISGEASALFSNDTHFTAFSEGNYPDLTYAAENAVQAVVNIENTREVKARQGGYDPFLEFFGIPQGSYEGSGMREQRSGGSGVIISSDGYIITNNHVVESASKLKVKLNDNRTFEATVVGTDPTTDVALIKIDAKDLPTLQFGDSDVLRLGEWVLAIGSPFDLQSTVTAGIVSAKARNLDVIPGDFRIESFIQTDAAVNPGNSGGALVNKKGELIGINTVIKSPTGSFTGYSFAIPSSIVKKVVVDLREFGVVQRAMLGISFREIDAEFIEQFGKEYKLTEQGGMYVAGVDPEGAAHAAGIKEGDIIKELDGTKLNNTSQLLEIIARHRPNEKVKVSVERDGKMKLFDVTLRNKAGKTELLKKDHVDAYDALGGTLKEINDKAKKELKIDGGLQVVAIKDGGILSQIPKLRKGFIITHINDREVKQVNDLTKITGKVTSIDGVYPDGKAASYVLYGNK